MKGVVQFSAFCGLAVAIGIGQPSLAQYYDDASYYSYPSDYSYPTYSDFDSSYSSNIFSAPPLSADEMTPFNPPMPESISEVLPTSVSKRRPQSLKSGTAKSDATKAAPTAEGKHSPKAQPAVLNKSTDLKAKPVGSQQSVLTTPTPDAAGRPTSITACQPVTGGKDPACEGCKFVLCPPTQPLVLNCDCCKDPAADQCPLYRFLDYNKAVAFISSNGLNPNCLVCVKEPFVCAHQVTEEVEIVLNRCKKTCNDKCEAGKCISESVSELEPCTAKYTLCHTKQYIKYCEVWIYIDCHHKVPAGTPPVVDCP